jgi:hypothetical protein
MEWRWNTEMPWHKLADFLPSYGATIICRQVRIEYRVFIMQLFNAGFIADVIVVEVHESARGLCRKVE